MDNIEPEIKEGIHLLDEIFDDYENFNILWNVVKHVLENDDTEQNIAQVLNNTFENPIGVTVEYILWVSQEELKQIESRHRRKYMSLNSCFRHSYLNYSRLMNISPNAITNIRFNGSDMRIFKADGKSTDIYLDMGAGAYLVAVLMDRLWSMYYNDNVSEEDKDTFEMLLTQFSSTRVGEESATQS